MRQDESSKNRETCPLIPDPDFDWMTHPIQHYAMSSLCGSMIAMAIGMIYWIFTTPVFSGQLISIPIIILLGFLGVGFLALIVSLICSAPLFFFRRLIGGNNASWFVIYLLSGFIYLRVLEASDGTKPEIFVVVVSFSALMFTWAFLSYGTLKLRS